MSATTTPTDFSDLYTDLQNRVRDATGVAVTQNIAKRYINIALVDMHIQDDFPWSIREALLVTQPIYTTGTVTISKGSTSLTGSSTAWNTDNDFSVKNVRDGGKMKLASVSEVYEVSAVSSDTALTISSAFTGSNLSGDTYTYFEDEYATESDFFRPVQSASMVGDVEIPIITQKDFFRSYVRNDVTGRPRIATAIDKPFSGNTNRVQKIIFHPAPDRAYTLRYKYITTNLGITSAGAAQTQLSGDTDEPIIPLRYRHVLIFHALYHWYRDRKDDNRSQEAKAEYVDLVRRIASDIGPTTSRPRIQFRKPFIGPFRRGMGRFSTGTWFEELTDIR